MLPYDPLNLKIIVLTTDNLARRTTMDARLSKIGFRDVLFFDNTGYKATEGHERILQMCKNQEWPYVMILEDDACFSEGFINYYKNNIQYINEHTGDWDMFYFGGNILHGKHDWKTEWIVEPQNICLYCNHAYIVNGSSFTKVLSCIKDNKGKYIIDDIYTRCSEIRIWLSVPMVITQIPPESYIDETLLIHNIMVKGYKDHLLS